MRRLVPLLLAAAGAAALAVAWTRGEVSVGLVLVFPVVLGTGPFALLGFGLWIAAGITWFVAASRRLSDGDDAPSYEARMPGAPEPERKTRHGGVLILGPFPIAWGSDRESFVKVLVLAVVLTLVTAVVFLFIGGRLLA